MTDMDMHDSMDAAPSCPSGQAETHTFHHFRQNQTAPVHQGGAHNNHRWQGEYGFAASGGPAEYFSNVHWRATPVQQGGPLHSFSAHAKHCEMGDREPEMQQEGEQSTRVLEARASPVPGSGMRDIEDLPCTSHAHKHFHLAPSPPPSGTSFDLLERAPTMPSSYLHQSSDEPLRDRTRRQVMQLNQWKTLLSRQPTDGLAFFWREQVASLEMLLHKQQKVGVKRGAEGWEEPRKIARANTIFY